MPSSLLQLTRSELIAYIVDTILGLEPGFYGSRPGSDGSLSLARPLLDCNAEQKRPYRRVTISMGQPGANTKSPKDTPWRILRQKPITAMDRIGEEDLVIIFSKPSISAGFVLGCYIDACNQVRWFLWPLYMPQRYTSRHTMLNFKGIVQCLKLLVWWSFSRAATSTSKGGQLPIRNPKRHFFKCRFVLSFWKLANSINWV